jgi:hypothetical protein
MNSDQEIITAAYADALKGLYAILFRAIVDAAGDAAQILQAERHFMTGVGFARSARDRAIALLAAAAASGA